MTAPSRQPAPIVPANAAATAGRDADDADTSDRELVGESDAA